ATMNGSTFLIPYNHFWRMKRRLGGSFFLYSSLLSGLYERSLVMLEVHQLCKSYGTKEIFQQLSFSVRPGVIIGFVGENGARKSTLLNILATLDQQTSGTITLNGYSYMKYKKQIRKQIGFVPQEIAVWEQFTVEENMIFFEKLSWKNKSRRELR